MWKATGFEGSDGFFVCGKPKKTDGTDKKQLIFHRRPIKANSEKSEDAKPPAEEAGIPAWSPEYRTNPRT